jgi:DNA processing protein
MKTDELAYLIALSQYPKFGARRLQKLLAFFSSPKIAFHADKQALMTAGIPGKIAEGFCFLRNDIHPEQLLDRLDKAGVKPITFADENYPDLLKHIFDPPVVLYVQGKITKQPGIGIVGSRKASFYGKQMAQEFSSALAQAGQVVISGLAYGIDEAAHQGTVDAGGVTIGVLAHGHEQMTSRTRYLSQKMLETGGAIISEFFPNIPAQRHHFPIRNRIISGMSHSLLVVEAGLKSGSLITAKSALEQGRDVYAIPGPITSETSHGTNQLIKDGALVALSPQDLCEALNLTHPPQPERGPIETEEEAQLLDYLSKQPIHINELCRLLELPTHALASTLALLELKGRTKQIGGMYYVLI